MPSERSGFDPRLNPLSALLASRRAAGAPVIDLTESNPTTAGVLHGEESVRAAFGDRAALRYEPAPFGVPSARQAVARLWGSRGVAVDPGRVVLTSSTSEAYSFLFKILCDPGDQVLVPAPSYPLFEHLARYECVEAKPYRLAYDGAWHVDFSSVWASVSERTRAVVLVTPNNPTGSYVKRDELARFAALGIPIVSDEVFGAYPLSDDASRPRSALEAEGALVFALDGLSKFSLLPQMKLAWISVAGPDRDVSEALGALELLTDTFLSPSGPVQRALPALLESSGGPRTTVLGRTRRNLSSLRERVAKGPVTVLDVEGGWYAVLRLPNTRTEENWAVGLLRDRDVLVQPGFFYDFEDEPYAVVSLLTPEPAFAEGIARVVEYVA